MDARLALIQSYCLNADWQKALNLTKTSLQLNPDDHINALLKNNIIGEIQRQKVLLGELPPFSYSNYDTPTLQLQLLQNYLHANYSVLVGEFDDLIQETDFQATITTYDKNIHQDTWIDSDFRFASILEVFIQENYYWLPLNAIKSIAFWDHEVLTDILWRRAHIILQDDSSIAAFIPARYPTHQDLPDLFKLNKMTQWQEIEGLPLAYGQKMLTSGATDIALLDIKSIQRY